MNRRERRAKNAQARKQSKAKARKEAPVTHQKGHKPHANNQPLKVAVRIEEELRKHYTTWLFCPACGNREQAEIPQHMADAIRRGLNVGVACPKCGQPLRLMERLIATPQEVAAEVQQRLTAQGAVPHDGRR